MAESKQLDDKKKEQYEVVHPKRYMAVAGKLQCLKVGDIVSMTEKTAAAHGKKFKKLVAAKSVSVGNMAPPILQP